jgi:hypothetical protein
MVGEGPPSTTPILNGNPWIPAFAGMTEWCRRRVEFNTGWYYTRNRAASLLRLAGMARRTDTVLGALHRQLSA